jgi:beta-lactamase regulating signal transducer with metallopeptidase domain
VDLLLNWLMQGTLVAMVAAAGLRAIPASRARARYGFVWAAYLVILALPAIPLALATLTVDRVTPVDVVAAPASPPIALPIDWWTSSAVAIGLWIIWSTMQMIQFAAAAVAVRDVRRQGRPCPDDVLTRLPYWGQVRASGRPTRVVLTDRVRGAAVLGCGAPIVALTPALIDDLSAADLDRVLVHEWAHVQRRDDIAQLIQRFVRVLAGWHPGLWWLGRQLDFEREAACDAVVVRVTGSAKGYATCLATLAAMPQTPVRPLLALAALGPSRLRRRVVRILATPAHARDWSHGLATVAAGASLALSVLAVADLRAAVFTHPPGISMTTTGTPASPSKAATGLVPTSMTSASDRPARVSTPARRSQPSTSRDPRSAPPIAEAATITMTPDAPAQSVPEPDPPIVVPAFTVPADVASRAHLGSSPITLTAPAPPPPAGKTRGSWERAADAGVTIGRVSQDAGLATAGFFTRFAKKIAGSF